MSARALGSHVESWDEDGKPLVDEVGELVIRAPMPSMPLRIWGDEDGSRYHDAYFDIYPGVWRHGDWLTITSRGTALIHGRSDSTLNRHGVRMGSSDIYQAVEALPEVAEALVLGIEQPDGGYWLPLFVRLADGAVLDEELTDRIRSAVRTQASPRHVPDEVLEVPADPAHHDRQEARGADQADLPGRRGREGVQPRRRRRPGRRHLVRRPRRTAAAHRRLTAHVRERRRAPRIGEPFAAGWARGELNPHVLSDTRT